MRLGLILVLFATLIGCNKKNDFLYSNEPYVKPDAPFQKAPRCYIEATADAADLGDDITFTLRMEGKITQASLGNLQQANPPTQMMVVKKMGDVVGQQRIIGRVSGPGGSQECIFKYEIKDVPLDCVIEADPKSSWMGDTVNIKITGNGKVKGLEIDGQVVNFPVGQITLPAKTPGTYTAHGKAIGPVTKVATCDVVYKVDDPTVTCKLVANPPAFPIGQTTTLTLNTTGPVVEAKLDGAVVAAPVATKQITPNAVGKYTVDGYVKGPKGEVRCPVTYKAREKDAFSKEVKHTIVRPIDIIWIVDNSPSMDTHQASVIKHTDVFMKEFEKAKADWKMGLLSTDIGNPPFVGFTATDELNPKTTDYATVFKTAVGKLGTGGDSFERPFAALQKALTDHKDFVRKDSVLASIIITDAPEQSNINAADMQKFLVDQKMDLESVRVYGGFASRDFNCSTSEYFPSYKGSVYETLIKATQGTAFPLCSPNFGADLANVANQIVNASKVTQEIPLNKVPDPASIIVKNKGKVLTEGPKSPGVWYYNAAKNAVIIHDISFATGLTEEVEIEYQVEIP